MILKKALLGVSIASIASLAQAQAMDCDYFTGAYIGANARYQSTNDKYALNKDVVNNILDANFSQNIDIYAGHDGWGGGLFAGYGKVINRAYLGGEIYSNMTVGKQKLVSEGDDKYIAMKSRYNYGAMAKIGYLVNPQALAYIGLGAENTSFKFVATQAGGDKDLLTTHKWGFVPSVGMNVALDCNWQIGAKLSYAHYRSMNLATDVDGKAYDVGTINPRRASFDLNVTYRFV